MNRLFSESPLKTTVAFDGDSLNNQQDVFHYVKNATLIATSQ